jgi:alkanesulfonate monooxygenase SsuD/methylene tetrahydromethanopterin reductase-like flavin-dependent oxidoreductase (luciferase family)
MEFGVMNLFPNPKGKTEKEVIDEVLEEFVYAEELGFDSVWLAEHHFSEYGILGNPLLFASLLAAKTKRIRIGTAVMILPFYNPVRLAEDAALVDLISEGRLDLGIGRGYQPKEFNGFKINPSESRGRFNESVDILKQAWTQDEVNYHGQYYDFEGISVHPKPVQKPHIPLRYAAVSTETYEIMGKAGNPIITSPNFTPVEIIKRNFDVYKKALTENGYNPNDYKFPLAQQIHIAPSSEQAKMTAVKNSKDYYNLLASLLPGSEGEEVVDEYKFFKKVQKTTETISLNEIERNGGNFGSPQEAIERIKYLEEEVGINQYICWFNFGQLGHKETLKTMELFAKEVMPAFQKSTVIG